MYTILRSAMFDRWLDRLRDRQAVNRIVARLLVAENRHLRRREISWRWRVRDEDSARARIPDLLHHARR